MLPERDDGWFYVVLAVAIALFVAILALIRSAAASPDQLERIASERAADYARYAHIEPDACGEWRYAAWRGLRDAGLSPLVTHRSGRTWLGALCCTLERESGLDPDAYRPASDNPNGGNDVGIAQFNDLYAPDAPARNPHLAIREMARWWSLGLEERWNAYPACERRGG